MLLHPLPKHSITVFLEAAAAPNFPNSVNQHRLKRPGLSQRASQVKDMETSLLMIKRWWNWRQKHFCPFAGACSNYVSLRAGFTLDHQTNYHQPDFHNFRLREETEAPGENPHLCERRKALEWNGTLSRLTTVKTTAPPCFCLEEEEETFSGRRQEASLVCWKGSRVCWRTSSSSRELSVDPQQTRTNRDEADDRVVSSLNRRRRPAPDRPPSSPAD